MRRTFLALSALAALAAGLMTVATAQEAQGPGGANVAPHHSRNVGNCRTIIAHRTNGMGNSVTIRRRVCD